VNEFEGQPFAMNLSDHTILEGDGEYERVKEIMEKESYVGCDWMVRSEVTIDFPTNSCIFIVHFYQNRDIYIVEYQSSVSDVFYNSDIPCISMWSQDKGWNCPQPHPDLIRDAMEFWKHFWETGILDSEYLDEKCGKRIVDYSEYIIDDEEEEE
jgi:hypothetical protein